MTWQLEHTITWNQTGDHNTQTLDAMKYFTDTFLPGKGWTSGPRPGNDLTSNYRIVQRNFTDLFTGNAGKHYLWFQLVSSTNNWRIYQYEDATYTTTPGDLGTDTTNTIDSYWHNTSQTWGQKNFKFWGSTENNKSFMVTRWDQILAWDPGIDWPVFKPEPGIAATESPSTDMWQGNLFLPCSTTFKYVNLPIYDNTSNSEGSLAIGPGMSTNNLGSDGGLWDKVQFYWSSYHPSVTWDQADVKLYMYGPASTTAVQSFMPVQVNSGNYWLFTRGNLGVTQMAFDLGTTLPDFN